MELNFRAMAALCSVAVSLSSGCESAPADGSSGGVSPLFSSGTGSSESVLMPYAPTEEDFAPVQLADCSIELHGDSVSISGSGARAESGAVRITDGGSYRISGSGSQRILLEGDEDVSIILDGASLQAPIECTGTARMKLTLAENSDNTLNASGAAGISSGGDITVNGSGSLYIAADSGIFSDGVVKLCGGSIEVAADGNGIHAMQAVCISGGEVILNSGGGSSAVMFIESGGRYPGGRHGGFYTDGTQEYDFDELTSGDNTIAFSKKGILSGGAVLINGGSTDIDSADDGISARGDVLINGGIIAASSGDDAVHADGCISVTDGTVEVLKSYTALDSLTADISGGELRLTSYRDGIKTAGGNDMGFFPSDSENADHYVSISGGRLTIDAGGDGIDAGGTAAISGGEVTIFTSSDKRFGSLSYADSFALSGGMLAAFGSDGLTRAPSIVSGICLSLNVPLPADKQISIADSSGDVLFSGTLPRACATAVFSCEQLAAGREYLILADGTEIACVTAKEGLCGDGPTSRGGSYSELPADAGMAA